MSQLLLSDRADVGHHANVDATASKENIAGFFDLAFNNDVQPADVDKHSDDDDDDAMLESPVAMARTPITPSGPLVARPAVHRAKSNSLSQRRPELRLQLTPDEQTSFNAAIEAARKHLVSDALKLPTSTNMGLGKNGPPAKVIKSGPNDGNGDSGVVRAGSQITSATNATSTTNKSSQGQESANKRAPAANLWPIPQPIADKERTRIPTELELTIKAYDDHAHSWEEAETVHKAPSSSWSPSLSQAGKPVYLRAIPCMYAANVANATSFYRDILGFSLLGKQDSSHASLFRSPTNAKPAAAVASSSSMRTHSRNLAKQAPADAVEIYIRITPMGPDGQRVKPPPTTLWILVNDVDAVFQEIQAKWLRFQPRTDEYFPMHTFGDAKILAKPQNKAWGNRELHIVDGDENKIIFFRETQ